MHNSHDGGQPMRYDANPAPAEKLLRAGTATELCLACHSGGGQGPNVTSPTDYDPPGGGFPADLADPLGQAHALGPSSVTPPDGDTPVVMGCTTCHDPHGNSAYRNLRPSPSGTGRAAATPIVVLQSVTANGTNALEVYRRSNVLYRSGFSEWCMDCHNSMAGTHIPRASLWSEPTVDQNHWLGPVANRVPVLSPSDVVVPSSDDQVFCLSCHKAHGTPHARSLVWAEGEQGGLNSTCAQCHPQ